MFKIDKILSFIAILIGLILIIISYYLVCLFKMVNIINVIPFLTGVVVIILSILIILAKE